MILSFTRGAVKETGEEGNVEQAVVGVPGPSGAVPPYKHYVLEKHRDNDDTVDISQPVRTQIGLYGRLKAMVGGRTDSSDGNVESPSARKTR